MRSMRKILACAPILAAALVLAACGGKPPVKPDATEGAGTGDTGTLDRPAVVAQDGTEVEDAMQGPAGGALDKRVIFFDFDSSEIRGDGPDIVAAHAKYLAGKPIRIRLEGHTDERGSREYNIGLGERRAQAVRRALMLQGAGLYGDRKSVV